MNIMRKNLVAIVTALIGATASAQAVTLQVDFGVLGTYVGNASPAAIPDTVWNGVGNVDVAAGGLVYSDGSPADGVSLDVGDSPDGDGSGGIIDFTGSNARGQGSNDTVGAPYDTLLAQDWLFTRQNADLGVRVTGLPLGTYDVFSINKEPNELTRTYDVGIGVVAATDINTLTRLSLDLATTSIGDATGATTFVEGQNFAFARVTITDPTDYIAVVVDPTNERFGTIGGLQIVGVPEPSSATLLAMGGFGFILRRRR